MCMSEAYTISYFNKTLLHKSLSGQASSLATNWIPLPRKPRTSHSIPAQQQLFSLGHTSLTQASATLPPGPNISHDTCFRKVWLGPESESETPHFLCYLQHNVWLRPELIHHPDSTFSQCCLWHRTLIQARSNLYPWPNISHASCSREAWLGQEPI